MGCVTSHNNRADLQLSRQIDKDLKRKAADEELKILILGIGESGKSTIVKQLRIIHDDHFSESEKTHAIGQIQNNVKIAVLELIECLKTSQITEPGYLELFSQIETVDSININLDAQLAACARDLYQLEVVKEYLKAAPSYMLSESTPYFLEHADRISKDDFEPCDNDLVRLRVRTTGIIEINIQHKGMKLKLCDVGGQRSERKKWISCFENVTCVLYIVALSDYDKYLVEDPTTNRMHESLRLFETISSTLYFKDKPMIIFFNKMDLYETKIQRIPLTVCFPEYTGDNTVENTINFLKQKFLTAACKNGDKVVYFYKTCATDTESVKFVFDACTDMIIRANLQEIGLG